MYLLYLKFHFDKRGEYKENESPTTYEPIFKYQNNQLVFRYLRNYIDAGQKIAQKPLTNEQNDILDKIEFHQRGASLPIEYYTIHI